MMDDRTEIATRLLVALVASQQFRMLPPNELLAAYATEMADALLAELAKKK